MHLLRSGEAMHECILRIKMILLNAVGSEESLSHQLTATPNKQTQCYRLCSLWWWMGFCCRRAPMHTDTCQQ